MNDRIGFSRPKNPSVISSIIRHFTKSEFSHCFFLYFDEDFKQDMVMEASDFGFIISPFKNFKQQNEVVHLITPKQDISRGFQLAVEWLGTRYDYAGLIGAGVVVAGRMLKKKLSNPFRSTSSVFCSEAVIRVLQAADYPGANAIEPEDATPQDVYAVLTF